MSSLEVARGSLIEEANIKIRLAAASDAAELARLRYELRAWRAVVENDAMFIERCTLWMQQRLLDQASWRCWIAEGQAMILGNVWAQLIEKIPNPVAEAEYYVYLTNFYIREDYRNRGIGSRLLKTVVDWSKSNNAQVVILWPTERSKTVYLRHGFTFPGDLMQLTLEAD